MQRQTEFSLPETTMAKHCNNFFNGSNKKHTAMLTDSLLLGASMIMSI